MFPQSLDLMRKRLGYYGDTKRVEADGSNAVKGTPGKYKRVTYQRDQWTRMREDKLRSLMHALHYSYQAAICQPFDSENYTVEDDKVVKNLTAILTNVWDQNVQELTETQIEICKQLEAVNEHLKTISEDERQGRLSNEYYYQLRAMLSSYEGPAFRCLINHDKLKVDYEDKIISIPYESNTVQIYPYIKDNHDWIETNFHNGTVFKWVHGNREEWVPDSYWIVYMQYSEETAYFRGEIRRADEEVQIIVINDDGSETTKTYRGWMTGPNEETLMWNVKKGIVWNDMNYTKKLYITKDEDTLEYFQRFDRVIINGQPWEVQAYNDNYGTSSTNTNTGILRVALKETYTSTDQQIKRLNDKLADTSATIIGSDYLSPYDEVEYIAQNASAAEWIVDIADDGIISWTIDNNVLSIKVLTTKAYRKGFNIKYGDLVKHIVIKSL